jgi:predicted metalloprotease with PDZ domain
MKNFLSLIWILLFSFPSLLRAEQRTGMAYTVTMENPGNHQYHVELIYSGSGRKLLNFRMSAWTPGFYEIQDFSATVKNFHAFTNHRKALAL